MTVEQIQSPWIQPGGRPDRDNEPLTTFFPFTANDAFFACSRAAVFSFTIAVELGRAERRRGGQGEERRRRREKGDRMEGTIPRIGLDAFYETGSEWLTGGPKQSNHISSQALARYVAKKAT